MLSRTPFLTTRQHWRIQRSQNRKSDYTGCAFSDSSGYLRSEYQEPEPRSVPTTLEVRGLDQPEDGPARQHQPKQNRKITSIPNCLKNVVKKDVSSSGKGPAGCSGGPLPGPTLKSIRHPRAARKTAAGACQPHCWTLLFEPRCKWSLNLAPSKSTPRQPLQPSRILMRSVQLTGSAP